MTSYCLIDDIEKVFSEPASGFRSICAATVDFCVFLTSSHFSYERRIGLPFRAPLWVAG
jgi:hypothetical protein